MVTWNIPDTITSQGLNSFTVVLIPECFTGPRGDVQRFNGDAESMTVANFGNLGMS